MNIRCNNCFKEYEERLGLCPFCGYAKGEPAEDIACLSPGTVISEQYIIGEKVSSGGFGIVYKAWDKKLETIVAVKEYYPRGLVNRVPGNPNLILVATKHERNFVYGKKRFLEEARNMAKFSSHKNIVNVFNYFEENNTAYIVMEFFVGKTLQEMLKEQNVPLPYEYCVNVALDLCKALKTIHKEKIIHRDVSPNNVMICNDGTVKLFDFGAALFSASSDVKNIPIVTVGFTPPEQYDKVNRQDERTDIYALGATLYYALTGVKPLESTDRKENDTLVEPMEIENTIPKNINNIIMRAMAVEKHNRFSNVEEIEKYLSTERNVASVKQEKRKRKVKRFVGIFASFLIVLLGVGFFAYSFNQEKEIVGLPDAELDVWYTQTADSELNSAKENALKDIVNMFTAEYNNVTINLVSVNEKEYVSKLSNAIKEGNAPNLVETTDLSDKSSLSLSKLTDNINSLKTNSYYGSMINNDTDYPVGIVVPVIYVNNTEESANVKTIDINLLKALWAEENQLFSAKQSMVDVYSELYGEDVVSFATTTAKNDFINGKTSIYLGDSADYFDIQNELAGEYSIVMPSEDKALYKNGIVWGVVSENEDSDKVVNELLFYFNSELAQDYLHIQNQSGNLPININSMNEYLSVYNELAVVKDYLKNSVENNEIAEEKQANTSENETSLFDKVKQKVLSFFGNKDISEEKVNESSEIPIS